MSSKGPNEYVNVFETSFQSYKIDNFIGTGQKKYDFIFELTFFSQIIIEQIIFEHFLVVKIEYKPKMFEKTLNFVE